MARRKAHVPLLTFLNTRLVGRLDRRSNGAIEFVYDAHWLASENSLPVSLSLPLREGRYTGRPVSAVFENLLPDSLPIRRRVAERVGAEGVDAYSLLTAIGRDCVGALQFIPDDNAGKGDVAGTQHELTGDELTDEDIAAMIANLGRAPLGIQREIDNDFRISIAGAQEKTALLRLDGRWLRPHGRTPTTHILKPQIGQIETAGGPVDLSNSVENEFYCLKLMSEFGLDTNETEIQTFGPRKVLVVSRFDRFWTRDGRLLRIPQEDFCQALSVPPTQKYENEGGPGIKDVVQLLKGADDPLADQLAFFTSQIIFWLIGATDGHAKNFSIHLLPRGRFRLTPFYDVLTAQPSLDAKQIPQKDFKLAMAVGDRRRYRLLDVRPRHFVQSAINAGLPKNTVARAILNILERGEGALERIVELLPHDFPEAIHHSVAAAARHRLHLLETEGEV